MRNDSYEFTYNGNSLTVKGSDRTYTCKLNSYGYVTEVTEDNDEKDGAIYYTLEYDKNGYLQRIEQRYSYNESRKRVSECTWRDGNLIESKLTDYYEDGTDITTVKYSYSKTTTPINIDLFYIDGGYIDVLEPLDLLGFYGRQSAKLPNKADITYSGESESESDDFGVYTLNGDGTVARIDCGSVSYELITKQNGQRDRFCATGLIYRPSAQVCPFYLTCIFHKFFVYLHHYQRFNHNINFS